MFNCFEYKNILYVIIKSVKNTIMKYFRFKIYFKLIFNYFLKNNLLFQFQLITKTFF